MEYKKLILKSKEISDDIIYEENLCDVYTHNNKIHVKNDSGAIFTIDETTIGKLNGKAICLPGNFNWIIRKDEYGCICLIPLKKK